MGFSEGLARIFVFVANFCFVLVGLALLVVGVLYKINFNKYTDAIPSDYQLVQYVPTLAIIIGVIIFVIAFLGCCGTLKSSTCMLTSYAAILFIIFLVQVGLGIFALITITNNDDLHMKIDEAIQKLFDRYDAPKSSKEAVDIIQKSLDCCGTNGVTYWALQGISIPESCPSNPLAQGCQTGMYNFVTSSVKIIGIVALGISLVEVLGAVLALCLVTCIKRG